MATRLPTAAQQDAADAIVDRADVGTAVASGRLRIYSGTQPASANSAPVGDLLVEIELQDPAYGSADSSGIAALLGVPLSGTGTVAAGAGTAAQSFRVVGRDQQTIYDGAAGGSGSGAELILDNVNIAEDQTVNVTALTYQHPAST